MKKFTVEFELSEDQIIDPNLPDEIIREKLINLLVDIWKYEPDEGTIWIDVSDDGDGDDSCNIYTIQHVK